MYRMTHSTILSAAFASLVLAGGCAPGGTGGTPEAAVRIGKRMIELLQARDGDGYILCSDGLWEMVKPGEMAGALAEKGLDDQPEALAKLAFDRAGRHSDNISIAMIRMGGPSAAAAGQRRPRRCGRRRCPSWLRWSRRCPSGCG